MTIDIRPYNPGDEQAILELFEASFGRTMSGDYWRWRFLDNPVGEPKIDLAWDGTTLAGHYAVSPESETGGVSRSRPEWSGRVRGRRSLYGVDRSSALGMSCFRWAPGRLWNHQAAEHFGDIIGR